MFSWLRKKRPSESAEFEHSDLGILVWSKKDNEWVGDNNGIIITLAYEDNCTEPSEELVSYVSTMILSNKINSLLEIEKNKLIEEVKELTAEQVEEVKALHFDSLNFSICKGVGSVFATFGPANDERYWRMEVFGENEAALGFDS